MGCPELDMTSYFRLVSPVKTASRRFRRRFPTPKTACTRQPLDVGFGLRFYNPLIGRWINRDPIEEKGGWNLYAMVANDVVNKWDYLGFCPPERDNYPPGDYGDKMYFDELVRCYGLPQPPQGPSTSTRIIFKLDFVTDDIREQVQDDIQMRKDNLLIRVKAKAKEKCAPPEICLTEYTETENYECFGFLYSSRSYFIGSVSVYCNTKVECIHSCGKDKYSCKDKTRCRYSDNFDFNLGLFTFDTGITFEGEWEQ